MKGRLRLIAAVTVAGYVVALVDLLGALAVLAAPIGPLAFVREMQLFLFVPAPLVLGLALVARSRLVLAAAVVPLVLFALLYGPHVVPRPIPSVEGPRLRVMSYNVGAARRLGQPSAIIELIRAVDPDVVCLVEARRDTLATVGGPLGAEYPYQAAGSSVFALSRFPLENARQLDLGAAAHDALLTDLVVDKRVATLAVVHLQRIDAFRGAGGGLTGLAEAALRFDPRSRDAAAAQVMAALRERSGSSILAGDFNTTPWSRTHQIVAADLRDGFHEAGWGLGHSYPAWLRTVGWDVSIPLLRIDYVFHSTDLVALGARVGPRADSDHLPIVVELAFRSAQWQERLTARYGY